MEQDGKHVSSLSSSSPLYSHIVPVSNVQSLRNPRTPRARGSDYGISSSRSIISSGVVLRKTSRVQYRTVLSALPFVSRRIRSESRSYERQEVGWRSNVHSGSRGRGCWKAERDTVATICVPEYPDLSVRTGRPPDSCPGQPATMRAFA